MALDPAKADTHRIFSVLLARQKAVGYVANDEEAAVLGGCETRAKHRGLLYGSLAAVLTQLALHRRGGVTLLPTLARTTTVLLAGTVAGVQGASSTSEACLCDFVATARTSPLGGEVVWLLRETAPQSKLLHNAPPTWEQIPRLPFPISAKAAAAASEARAAGGGGVTQAPDVEEGDEVWSSSASGGGALSELGLSEEEPPPPPPPKPVPIKRWWE